MSRYTPYGFNGDDYDDQDDGLEITPALYLVEMATRCIEHNLLPCAVCDGVLVVEQEPLTLAA